MFFGAGNLILPPLLGLKAGDIWVEVFLGFAFTAVLIPIMGVWVHAKLQGTLEDFAKKLSERYAWIYAVIIYGVSVALPTPRTAAVTHEISVAPFFDIPAWLTSLIYFSLVLLFAINRSTVIETLGKYLSPIIAIILIWVIGASFLLPAFESPDSHLQGINIIAGMLEGYQTFDALGGVVVGGVIVVSVGMQYPTWSRIEQKKLIFSASVLAGLLLLGIYAGLIFAGSRSYGFMLEDVSNVDALRSLIDTGLGNIASLGLSILVAVACFTTAVGIVSGASDYAKSFFGNSQKAYQITAILASFSGVIFGQLEVSYILKIAMPVLYLVYPLTIALIILNLLNERWANKNVFRVAVLTTLLFSLPDAISSLFPSDAWNFWYEDVPLADQHLAWLMPFWLSVLLSNAHLLPNKKAS